MENVHVSCMKCNLGSLKSHLFRVYIVEFLWATRFYSAKLSSLLTAFVWQDSLPNYGGVYSAQAFIIRCTCVLPEWNYFDMMIQKNAE